MIFEPHPIIELKFHDKESKNISGESIRGAALINFFVPDAALIQVNMVMQLCQLGCKF